MNDGTVIENIYGDTVFCGGAGIAPGGRVVVGQSVTAAKAAKLVALGRFKVVKGAKVEKVEKAPVEPVAEAEAETPKARKKRSSFVG